MSKPLTPFEESNGGSYTSYEAGEAFLDIVAASGMPVRKTKIGTSVLGRPITAVVIGYPNAPTWESLEDSVLIVATQHGNEPCPREAALQLVRDLAYDPTPADIERLRDTPMVVIPTANPDGTHAQTRSNAAGQDLNHDHLTLNQPETRALAETIRVSRPIFLLDAHEDSKIEYAICGGYYAPGAATSIKEFAPTIAHFMEVLFSDYGYGPYPTNALEGLLREATTLRGIPVLLTETLATQGAVTRVEQNLRAMLGLYRFASDSAETLRDVRRRAEEEYFREGQFAYAPSYGYEAGTISAKEGYWVPREGDMLRKLQLLGITYVGSPDAGVGGAYVSMAQPAAGLIPLVMDPSAPRASIPGEPVTYTMGFSTGLGEGLYPPGLYVRQNGQRVKARQLVVKLGGKRVVVWGMSSLDASDTQGEVGQ